MYKKITSSLLAFVMVLGILPNLVIAQGVSDNIDFSNGGVDASPMVANLMPSGDVHYSYQVSLNPVVSSDNVQTANSFTFTVPSIVKDVKFTLIGTQGSKDPNVSLGEIANLKPMDVEQPLGIQSYNDYRADGSDHQIPYYDNFSTTDFSNKVIEFGPVGQGSEKFKDWNIKQYGIVSNIPRPVGIRVDLIVDAEVAAKNPRLAIDVRSSWRGFHESDSFLNYQYGAEPLVGYRGTLGSSYNNSFSYVSDPSKILDGSYDLDGLHGTSDVGVTQASGTWKIIGRDLSSGWNYADTFKLYANPGVLYIAPKYEDMADVAVVEYKEKVIQIPFETISTPNLALEPGVINVLKEGVIGEEDTNGKVLKEKVDKEIEYGPELILFETIRKENPNLKPGEEKVITEGKNGRKDLEGKILVEKVDQVIEYGPKTTDPKDSTNPKDPVDPKDPTQPEEPGKLNKKDHIAYIQGYPDNTVKPMGNVSREEVAAVFYRLLKKDYKTSILKTDNQFPDVNSGRWSNRHISTLSNGKILNGYPDGNFKPINKITRGELAAIASRFDNLSSTNKKHFSDTQGHWAEDRINSAAEKGWIKGYPDGTFKPNQYITRAEFVTLVNNVLVRHTKVEDMTEDRREFPDLKQDKWYYEAMQEAINSHNYIRNDGEKFEAWTNIYYPQIEM